MLYAMSTRLRGHYVDCGLPMVTTLASCTLDPGTVHHSTPIDDMIHLIISSHLMGDPLLHIISCIISYAW